MAVLELAQSLPDDRKSELKLPFLQLDNPADKLDYLAPAHLAAGDGNSVEVIVSTLLENVQTAGAASRYLAEAKLLNKDYKGAARLFAAALASGEQDDNSQLVRRYAESMISAGQGTDAYPVLVRHTSPDAALVLLSELLLLQKQQQSLDALLWQATDASDPYLSLIRGEKALQAEDFATAAIKFGEACATPAQGSLHLPRARQGLIYALHR